MSAGVEHVKPGTCDAAIAAAMMRACRGPTEATFGVRGAYPYPSRAGANIRPRSWEGSGTARTCAVLHIIEAMVFQRTWSGSL